ncbi:hypothetical protein EVJ58_g1268 [Rhodofomes roseus]|uniref:Uncharacterized protein n=1 Tax=Rhodofomes roseus TaxID=34475 RepID=A0A4Y9Z2F3_9APHY|nr:hypothetical protein EVJ58_g1268 [Rhodofomes roseus]
MAKGICAIIPSDAANPAVDEPIPAYAQAWDPTIRRPTHLPEDYDERIAPEYIFFLPAGPEETADGLTEAGVTERDATEPRKGRRDSAACTAQHPEDEDVGTRADRGRAYPKGYYSPEVAHAEAAFYHFLS